MEVLYLTFKSLSQSLDYGNALEIDYGAISPEMEQYWGCMRGKEALAMDPATPIDFPGLFKSVSVLSHSDSQRLAIEKSSQGHDSFEVWPPELLVKLMLLLPGDSVDNLRASSRRIASIPLGNNFWRPRVRRDMPWIYELASLESSMLSKTVDWKAAYKLLDEKSRLFGKSSVLGLANRRRMWKICETIAQVYWKFYTRRLDVTIGSENKLGNDLVLQRLPRIAIPSRSHRPEPFKMLLVSDWSDIGAFPLSIGIAMTREDGPRWSYIETCLEYTDRTPRLQSSSATAEVHGTVQKITVPKGDWIVALQLTFNEIGDEQAVVGVTIIQVSGKRQSIGLNVGSQRLYEVASGNCFVGCHGETNGTFVTSFGIIEGKPPDEQLKVAKPDGGTLKDMVSTSAAASSDILKYIWTEQVPPLQLVPSDVRLGYWIHDFPKDISPMSVLILGTCEADFNSITAISADVGMGGFAVHRKDRPSEFIGPRHQSMKSLSISGSEGERIVALDITINHMITGIAWRTNWDRQMIIGNIHNQTSGYNTTPAEGYVVGGFFCSWGYKPSQSGEGGETSTCALLSLPKEQQGREEKVHPANQSPWVSDDEEHYWDGPSAPASYVTSGPIYGNNAENADLETGGNHRIEAEPHLISWLDCSKTVDRVEIWFTHPQKVFTKQQRPGEGTQFRGYQFNHRDDADVQFVSVILRFSDGTISSVGPRDFDESFKNPTPDAKSPCTCALYYKTSDGPVDLPFKLHFHRAQWQVGGQKLKQLRLWTSAYVNGLQFTSESGEPSPVFGKEVGEHADISFGDGAAVSDNQVYKVLISPLLTVPGWTEDILWQQWSTGDSTRHRPTGLAGHVCFECLRHCNQIKVVLGALDTSIGQGIASKAWKLGKLLFYYAALGTRFYVRTGEGIW